MNYFINKDKNGIQSGDELNIKRVISTIILIVIAIIFLFGSFRSIDAGQVGIKTRFGKVIGTQLNEGLNFKLPMIEKITKISIKTNMYPTTGAGASKDLQDVSIAVAVNYNVDATKAVSLFKNVGTNYETIIIAPAVQEAIKSVVSSYTAEELITKRAEVSGKISDVLESKTEKYGLKVQTINITNFNFSATYTQAIEAKQVAEMEVATAKNNLERARVEAERKVVEAKGTADANKLLEESLTKEIIEQRFIEKWDGKLPTVYGNSDSILDVTSLLK